MLRRACAEGAKRLNLLASDSGAQVDRRIVVKLLLTFFERGQSPEVLNLMGRMLGFTSAPCAVGSGAAAPCACCLRSLHESS